MNTLGLQTIAFSFFSQLSVEIKQETSRWFFRLPPPASSLPLLNASHGTHGTRSSKVPRQEILVSRVRSSSVHPCIRAGGEASGSSGGGLGFDDRRRRRRPGRVFKNPSGSQYSTSSSRPGNYHGHAHIPSQYTQGRTAKTPPAHTGAGRRLETSGARCLETSGARCLETSGARQRNHSYHT